MNDTAARARRKARYPGYWDYRSPRTPQEYLDNNALRRRARERRRTAGLQRLLAVSAGFFLWACVLALLVGGATW